MEDIKTSLDKIVAQFNDSVTHSAPKKLKFQQLNDSLDDSSTITKKRRVSGSFENGSFNNCLNVSGASLNTSANEPTSPWQIRTLRADLIEATSTINSLQQQLKREGRVRREMETLYENKFFALKQQCDYSGSKISEQDRHIKGLRKREQMAKQDLIQATSQLEQQKLNSEEKIRNLERQKFEIEESYRATQNSLKNEISEYRRCVDKMQMELDMSHEELDKIRDKMDEYKKRTSSFDELQMLFEKEKQAHDAANCRIKELESEISSYNDWKEITKNSQARLQSIPEMQKELDMLKANNKHLHELISNKLLLEEQVHDYKTRLEKEEGARCEVVALQVKLSHMEQELKEWVKVAQDHCLANTLVSPLALRARIEQLLKQDIVSHDERSISMSDTKSMQSTLHDVQQKCDIYMKNIEELNIVLKKHKNFKERLQRKLLTVSRERDFYKQLLDNFDKDLTVSNSTTTDMQTDTQMRYRVEVLERTVAGYKEMCSTLEREMNAMRQQESVVDPINEGYDHVKKELDALRMENDKLRRRKDELELELEHRCLKGDFNIGNYKVVHMTDNPSSEAYENSKNFIEKLQAEIERLKRRNKKLEDDNEQTQSRQNETTNMTMNIMEVNQLRAELESTNSKMKKLKECYKAASLEYRDVCYMLLGYRIDRIGANSNYKLSSMYAESPDDYLNFRLNESNALELLETPYSITLKPLIEAQLVANKSYPAFLSALTLELFHRSTITIT